MTPGNRLSQAAELINLGRWEQAEAALQRFLSSSPAHAVALGMLAFVHSQRGDPRRAVYFLERAIALDPKNADLRSNLGNAYLALGETPRALAAYSDALEVDPDHISAAIGKHSLLVAAGRLDEAEDLCRALLAAHPDHPRVLGNLAMTIRNTARPEEAVALLREAVSRHPADGILTSGLALSMNYASGMEPEAVFQAHAGYARLLGAPGPPPPLDNPDPEKMLRVGIVSSDLRSHSVAYFIEPWLEHHDRGRASLIAYSLCPPMSEDGLTARLKGYFTEWHSIPGLLPHESLAAQVRKDRIDILIDLDGHTGRRLPIFQMRPAPVQVSYLGYPNTTGLRTMDWRITDSLADPPGSAQALASERLWRLDPCFLCYQAPKSTPDVGPVPPGPFTFGSFNAAAKLSSDTLALWAETLKAIPGSRLLLKNEALSTERVRANIRARLEAKGVAPERIEFLGRRATLDEHLATYERVHVALDPFPYHGTTTTCEALFMGVPVVSMHGRVHASRVGLRLLTAIGLPELSGGDPAAFTRIAGALATDPARLGVLRASMRDRMMSSVLCDGRAFAARFDGALRSMWRERCVA